jgi:hypothetical protein
MKQESEMTDEIEESELPVSGAVRVQRRKGYGSVPDLDDEEPADIGELQRIVAWQMYAPLLALAGRKGRGGRIRLDAGGEIDWDAIGPAGGRRRRPRPGVVRPVGQAEQLGAELAHVVGLIGLLHERVPGTAKYLVLKYVRMGILDVEHIESHDLRELAVLEARARRLQEQLAGRTPRGQRQGAAPRALVVQR